MKRSLRLWLLVASGACVLAPTAAPAATPVLGPELKLERVVMLMRHGIRPPTKAQPIPVIYSPMAWPAWSVGPGLLTKRGAQGVGLLAAADRDTFIASGLLPASGCPAPGQVAVRASKVLRAIDTAKSWSASLLPGCDVKVRHPAKGAPDRLFHILETQPAWFDGRKAYESALAQAPSGGLAAQAKELAPLMRRLGAVLGCAPPACALEKNPSTLVARPHDKPGFKGPLDAASTASESLLLEYVEGMPMSAVGWGRATRDEIERLLVFNSIKFHYVERPSYIAKAAAGPLTQAIMKALSVPAGPRITLLAGHDTNIADLGGLLDMHWRAASYPADAVPPGSALGFELWSNRRGRKFVRAFFRSQTMDQLRNLEPLGPANRPYRAYVSIPGCGSAEDALGCDLPAFIKTVASRLQ